MSFRVAIDGPAGTGKGTITKLIAKELGLLNVDTGALYRCVTLEMLRRNLVHTDEQAIIDLIDEIKIEIKNEQGEQTIFLNSEDVSSQIRTKEVTDLVSQVSSIIGVRLKVTQLERAFGKEHDIIMEGRDIGTYVFPDADVKIYLDASPEERAKRRWQQNKLAGIEMSYEEVLENINLRDKNDKEKEIGALAVAKDAVVIDTTNMTIDQANQAVKDVILKKYHKGEEKMDVLKEKEKSNTIIQKRRKKYFQYRQGKWKLFQGKMAKVVLNFLYKVFYRIEIVGRDNLPAEGAYIVCANHINFLDPPAVVVTAKRKINMMAKEELLKNRILCWLGYVFDAIPVKRGSQDMEAIKRCLTILNEGGLLALYPEGTRNGLQKNNGKVKNGAAFFVARTGVPVLPIGIQGTFKPFTKVIVNYGKPMDFSQYQSKKPEKEVLEKISNDIMDEIIRLTNEKI